MGAYKTILVAIDIDGGAETVLAKASALVDGDDARIIVLDVVDLPFPIYDSAIAGGLYAPVGLRLDEETVKENREKELSKLVSKSTLSVSNVIVECGRPVATILEVAKREEADLIIIGSHGKHGVELLLGSTANGVLHRATTDVLAVTIAEKKPA